MKKYVFKPYNKIFAELFQREKQRIVSHIKEALIIEHVGSSAVPHLGGKGLIDIAIGVNSKEFESVSNQLQNLGYEFRPKWSTSDRLFLRADLPDPEEGIRRYHIHLMDPLSRDWKEMLAFRDHLRENPEDAQRYAELKKQAAAEVNEDGAKYRELKGPFFTEILNKINKEN